jgi:flavorubredoxin
MGSWLVQSGLGGEEMKITIVHESMFGNTHEVATAIGDGVREAQPDADVECVPVGEAAPELIKSTDRQRQAIVGPPQPSTPALAPQWRAVRPVGLPAACVSTATTW